MPLLENYNALIVTKKKMRMRVVVFPIKLKKPAAPTRHHHNENNHFYAWYGVVLGVRV